MSDYQCEICGHLNTWNMGSNPIKQLENVPCQVCIRRQQGKPQPLLKRTRQILITNPDLIESIKNCSCKTCKPNKNNKLKEIFYGK